MAQYRQQEPFVTALATVRNLLSPTTNLSPPMYLKQTAIPAIVLDACKAIQAPFHAVARSLLLHPDQFPPESSKLCSPVGRFLALSSWDMTHGTFLDVRNLFGIMAHLQWGLRMVGFVHYQDLCAENPETTTLSYVLTVDLQVHR